MKIEIPIGTDLSPLREGFIPLNRGESKDEVKVTLGRVTEVECSSQYLVCDIFLRIQEYYESPFVEIKDKVFSLEYYTNLSIKEHGSFDYHSTWSGFNVPGDIANRWVEDFKGTGFRHVEKEHLVPVISELKETYGDNYALIGYINGDEDILDHEYCHALYYLNPSYRDSANNLIREMESINPDLLRVLGTQILGLGYHPDVLYDEIQAYLATSDDDELRERFNIEPAVALEFQKLFIKYNKGR